ncbi:MAG: glucodextranase DOMON-like domain-containing protein, partial [Bacillota bacterium]
GLLGRGVRTLRRRAPLVALAVLVLTAAWAAAAPSGVGSAQSDERPLYVALIWHMHQPYYKDPVKGVYMLPWVRMHAVKDYYDMAAMLRRYPGMKATFNLVPSLLEQLDDYVKKGARDVYQILAEKPAGELTPEDKAFILRRFFDANWDNIIKKHPRYWELLLKRGTSSSDEEIQAALNRFTVQDFRDLQVWFNLGWLDPDFLREDAAMAGLVAKGRDFTEADKQAVMAKHQEIMAQVVDVYRSLMETGQIEVITAPYYHPILTLLLNTDLARVASPSLKLPQHRYAQPGDVEAQLQAAVEAYRQRFGREPQGLWPSEQAVGQDIVTFVTQAGFKWMVSSEGVLEKSLGIQVRGGARELVRPDVLYRPYWVTAGGRQVAILFRDIVLSDRIGFSYSGMPAAQAVEDFIGYLHRVRKSLSGVPGDHIVTVALDGENAWEWYRNDGKEFLDGLYRRLSSDPLLKPVTVAEYLEEHPPTQTIPKLWTGSWISDNLETWIGEEEENKAWDYLYDARTAMVRYEALHYGEEGFEQRMNEARRALYAAEGSDWFWWYGSDQDSGNDAAFDGLFRTHLRNIYQALGEPVPEYLYLPIIGRAPARPDRAASGRMTPTVDGTAAAGEWDEALRFKPAAGQESFVDALYVGNDAGRLYLRADLNVRIGELRRQGVILRFYLSNPRQLNVNAVPRESGSGAAATVLGYGLAQELSVDLSAHPPAVSLSKAAGGGRWEAAEALPAGSAAVGIGEGGRTTVVEVAVPFGTLDLQAAEAANVSLVAVRGGAIEAVLPATGPARLQVPEVIGGDLLLEWEDPVGDDHGPGSYVYPGNAVFTPAVFDMKRFQVFKEGNDVVFKVSLVGEIQNVWNSPVGLSVQTIDIYIDRDHRAGSGKTEALGGRRVKFAPESGWEYAIWVEGWNQKIFAADGSEPEGASRMRVSVDSAERSVTVRVPVAAIGAPESTWGFQVFILGQEGYPEADSLRVREVKANRAEWRFGGGEDDVFDPNVIDMLAPRGTTQEAILSQYRSAEKRLAVVPMVYGGR